MELNERGHRLCDRALSYQFVPPREPVALDPADRGTEVDDAYPLPEALVVAAAGNSGAGTVDVDCPGRSEHCISVAALNMDLTPASFSSAGDKIDTSGPDVNIISTRSGGGLVSMSGTSMACPWVAGGLGLFRSALKDQGQRIPSVYELRDLLFSRSTDTHLPGDDRRTGPGWLTPLLLRLALTPDPPPVSPG